MITTQFYLEKEKHQMLKKMAIEKGVSMSELIRRGIDELIEQMEKGEFQLQNVEDENGAREGENDD